MASVEHNYNLNTRGSKLTYLTSGSMDGGIWFANSVGVVPASSVGSTTVTGIVIPIGRGSAAGEPFSDATKANMIGDPAEKNYGLSHSDFFATAADVTAGNYATVGDQKDGGAQKFINAVLDGAYVAYNSGVQQGSGLSSMTVTRGDMTLTNSNVTNITGIVNTYSRSYSVTFNYKQSGFVEYGQTAALPDITNDLSTEDGSGPF